MQAFSLCWLCSSDLHTDNWLLSTQKVRSFHSLRLFIHPCHFKQPQKRNTAYHMHCGSLRADVPSPKGPKNAKIVFYTSIHAPRKLVRPWLQNFCTSKPAMLCKYPAKIGEDCAIHHRVSMNRLTKHIIYRCHQTVFLTGKLVLAECNSFELYTQRLQTAAVRHTDKCLKCQLIMWLSLESTMLTSVCRHLYMSITLTIQLHKTDKNNFNSYY